MSSPTTSVSSAAAQQDNHSKRASPAASSPLSPYDTINRSTPNTQKSPPVDSSDDEDIANLDYSSWEVPKNELSLEELLNLQKKEAPQGELLLEEEHDRKEVQVHNDHGDDVDVVLEKDYSKWVAPSTTIPGPESQERETISVSANTTTERPRVTLGATEDNKIHEHLKNLKHKLDVQREQDPDQDFENMMRPEHLLKMSLDQLEKNRNRDRRRDSEQDAKMNNTDRAKMRFSLADLGIESDTESDEEEETLSYDEWKKRHEQKKKQLATEQLARQNKTLQGRTKPRDLFTGLLDQFERMDDRPGKQRYTPQLSPEEHRKFLKWMFPLCE